VEEKFIVIAALVSPYRLDREKVRARIGPGRFVEVFVDCPLAECERRDPKGFYHQARQGKIEKFTGISDPYEQPLRPDIHLRTDRITAQAGADEIMAFFAGRILPHYPVS
jgi:adenylylsulfate kinase